MDWLLEHGDDADVDNPLTPQQISQISRVHRLFAPRAPPPQTAFTPDQGVRPQVFINHSIRLSNDLKIWDSVKKTA